MTSLFAPLYERLLGIADIPSDGLDIQEEWSRNGVPGPAKGTLLVEHPIVVINAQAKVAEDLSQERTDDNL